MRFAAGATATKQLFIDGVLIATADAHPGQNLGNGAARFGFVGAASQANVFNGAVAGDFFRGELDRSPHIRLAINAQRELAVGFQHRSALRPAQLHHLNRGRANINANRLRFRRASHNKRTQRLFERIDNAHRKTAALY
jgi:hypothetical protein